MNATEPIDETIQTVAVRRLGVVDTSVVRHFERGEVDWSGEWYLLSVKLPGDAEWTLLGRRRTKAELLTLSSVLDPRHLAGRNFGRCVHEDDWN